ncbi:hypothetical protein LP414_33375 [Polaromonas sp. P1(28)-13]|nr:hypothetical protein LP414_33375 [Polaromonas sp. P1(28)-13]
MTKVARHGEASIPSLRSAAWQSMAVVYPRWIATACGLAMTKVARHGEAYIPSLQNAARQSTAVVHPPWIATATTAATP